MTAPELPRYQGALTVPSWTPFRMTAGTSEALRSAARKDCRGCLGVGWTGTLEAALACPCVFRPLDRQEEAPR
jgi:hypothetical protein